MACEVAVERSLSSAFSAKGLAHLEDAVLDLLNGYNLAPDRNRKLYEALTGDAIAQQPFWPQFKESAKRRNKVVHESRTVGVSEAEESVTATEAFIAHLKQ